MSTIVEQIENVKSRIADLAKQIVIVNKNMNYDKHWIDKTKGYIVLGRSPISNPEGNDVLSLREKNRKSLLSSDKELLEMHEDARNQKLAKLVPLKAQLQQAEDELRALEALLEGENSQA
ncbi:hypothetical protein BGZ93_010073 [Podila epicladia]|nr:hypothetical protein BGZ92_011868 [Podila epicladia]KAG0089035.1 hypothetical protein BGZ93_010073 [Podila epicladia]